MADLGTGAGLAALGFWCFIAFIVVAGVWDSIRKRDAEHETLRRIIESGQTLDIELTERLLSVTGGSRQLDRDLKVGGLIMVFIAPGMILLGWGLSTLEPELFPVMLGIAGLIGLISIGLLVASWVVRRWYTEEPAPESPTA